MKTVHKANAYDKDVHDLNTSDGSEPLIIISSNIFSVRFKDMIYEAMEDFDDLLK